MVFFVYCWFQYLEYQDRLNPLKCTLVSVGTCELYSNLLKLTKMYWVIVLAPFFFFMLLVAVALVQALSKWSVLVYVIDIINLQQVWWSLFLLCRSRYLPLLFWLHSNLMRLSLGTGGLHQVPCLLEHCWLLCGPHWWVYSLHCKCMRLQDFQLNIIEPSNT